MVGGTLLIVTDPIQPPEKKYTFRDFAKMSQCEKLLF
jgi:hypothetical protein